MHRGQELRAREYGLVHGASARTIIRKEILHDASALGQGSDAVDKLTGSGQSLRIWLAEQRLIHHEANVLAVAGRYAAVEDMPELPDEDIEQIQQVRRN